jgi:arylsulfatase A-like enzyme
MDTKTDRPNIVFIMSDDHASHAMSCYGSRINRTPNLDRIADEGMRFDNCFCTNGICTPSRAAILTGTYNHINGVTTLATHMDNRLMTYPKLLQEAGYQTAMFGKWHLGQGPEHEPTGFDDWRVLPGQGLYHDPELIDPSGQKIWTGYVTDLITDMSLQWLKDRNKSQPFALMVHHKAPHREWEPDAKHADMYENEEILEPETFYDDYENRSSAAAAAKMRMEDLQLKDLKQEVPAGLSPKDEKRWRYQRYIKDYLRVVASVDDNVGRVLDYLEDEGLVDNTLVIYTSDQGFFLGDHGWFDKRFMYEESLRMPFVARLPREVKAGTTCDDFVLNVDFASLFLDLAGVTIPDEFQGRSFRPLLHGKTPPDWRQSMYYRYWMHADGAHNVYAHYGARTHDHKLIYFYNDGCGQKGSGAQTYPPEWELFDLKADPCEMKSIVDEDSEKSVRDAMTVELHRLQEQVGDERYHLDV